MRPPRRARRTATLLAACALTTAPAGATWSILIADTRTGEIAVGSATCLVRLDLRASTPVLITGLGAATAQSVPDSSGQNRTRIRDMLLSGAAPGDIIEALAQTDTSHESRQYGILDAFGNAATFTGANASDFAGGLIGQDGHLVFAVQGNILTGEPVVTAARDAILNTPGDLADKLMAAMEAARAFGGDGRCSCPGNPTGCGSPPDDFEKTADIAYMLIARAGDLDACSAVYPASGLPWGFAAADLTGNQRTDIAVSFSTGTQLAVYTNATLPDSPFAALDAPVLYEAGPALRDIAAADFTNNGSPDLAVASFTTASVRLLPANGDGTFADPVELSVGNQPLRLAAADFNGDGIPDLAVTNQGDNSVSILLADGLGGFDPAITIPLPAAPAGITAADLNANAHADLVITLPSLSAVAIYHNDGDAGFTLAQTLDTGAGPASVIAANLGGDGSAPDLATANTPGQSVTVLRRTGAGYTRTDLPTLGSAIDLRATRLAGPDAPAEHDDLAVLQSGPGLNLGVFAAADGAFLPRTDHPFAPGANTLALADLTSQGLDAAVSGSRTSGGVIVLDNLGGTYTTTRGCAAGDYYMTLNVAFAERPDPDPVFQLQDMFDQWAAALVARPDAVRTTVGGPRAILAPAPGSTTPFTLTLHVADRGGHPVTAPLTITAAPAPGSDNVVTLTDARNLGNGEWALDFEAAAEGADTLRITLDDAERPVTLMPAPTIRVAEVDPDFNNDGRVDIFDALDFLTAFESADPAADLDNDGEFTIDDVLLFLAALGA